MFLNRLIEFSEFIFVNRAARFAFIFVLYAALVVGFVELAESVTEGETLTVDTVVLQAIYSLTNSTLSTVLVVLTELGSTIFVALAAIGITAVLIIKRAYKSALFTIASIGGAGMLILLLKQLFARQRPTLWEQLVVENGYSFPSGHAIGSSALALTVIVLLWRSKWRLSAIVIGILYILLVAFSRLYLGVHYPSDVLASWLVSSLWLLSVIAVFRYGERQKSRE